MDTWQQCHKASLLNHPQTTDMVVKVLDDKRSSLFAHNISSKEKEFNKLDTRHRCDETFTFFVTHKQQTWL
jgi:hypothetical protein